MSAAPRVVLDTNVVLSALVFSNGRVAPIRHAWHDARCRPLASRATTAELMRALAYPKFGLSGAEREQLLADYLPYCSIVQKPARPPRTPDCRDPSDVPFLQLALTGKADYLVTGDRDLLAVAGRFRCPILAPDQFLVMVGMTPGTRLSDVIGCANYGGPVRSAADTERAMARRMKSPRDRGR